MDFLTKRAEEPNSRSIRTSDAYLPLLANLSVKLHYLGQALVCEALIKRWDLIFDAATAVLNNAGLYLKARGQYQAAEPLLRDALAVGEKRYGVDHPDTYYLLGNLAILYRNQGKHEEAEPLYQRALAIDEKVYGQDHLEVATDLSSLATLYADQSKYEEAEPLYQRALAIREKTLGPEHPDTISVRENYTALLEKMGQTTTSDVPKTNKKP
jgi:tetratricopeptide (TPR) repeat protein